MLAMPTLGELGGVCDLLAVHGAERSQGVDGDTAVVIGDVAVLVLHSCALDHDVLGLAGVAGANLGHACDQGQIIRI